MEYYRILENICDQYEELFKDLERRFDGAEFKKQQEALVWEENGCKLVLFLLHSMKLPYEITVDDIRPHVLTTTGKMAEIEWRDDQQTGFRTAGNQSIPRGRSAPGGGGATGKRAKTDLL